MIVFSYVRWFLNGLVLGAIIFCIFLAAMFIGLYELTTGQWRGDFERMKI